MKHNDALWKMNLQMFGDDPEPDPEPETAPEPESEAKEPEAKEPEAEEPKEPDDKPRTYTEAEVNDLIRHKIAEANKKRDKEVKEAVAEAEKLAKMNEDQKQQYEYEKLQKENEEKDAEIAELKRVQLRAELSRSAAQIMKEQHHIVATQDMLDFVVGDDAEQTNQRIDKLVGIIKEDRKAQEKARNTGKTPKGTGQNQNEASEIDKRIMKYQKKA